MTTNIYPARVSIGQQMWPKARVRTDQTEQRLQVWVTAQGYPHRPVCIIDEHIESVPIPFNKWARVRDRIAQYELESGTLEVVGLAGCGCASSLKNLPGMTSANQAITPEDVGV